MSSASTGLAFNTSLGSDCAWLSLSPTGGTTGTPAPTITVSVTTSAATAGAHSCVITFSAPGVSPAPTVTATITVGAGLTVSPQTLNFGTYRAGAATPAAQSISVSASGAVAFTTTLGSGCSWLSISPSSGNTPATVAASVNVTSLPPGNYTCAITITAAGASQQIQASMVVVASATLLVTPATINFAPYTIGSTSPSPQRFSVTSTNPASGVAFTLGAGPGCGWLTLPAGGSTPATDLALTVNTAAISADTSYSCTVTLSSASAGNSPQFSAALTVLPNSVSLSTDTLTFSLPATNAVPAAQPVSISGPPSAAFKAAVTTDSGGQLAVR